jgi:hypothetical protein
VIHPGFISLGLLCEGLVLRAFSALVLRKTLRKGSPNSWASPWARLRSFLQVVGQLHRTHLRGVDPAPHGHEHARAGAGIGKAKTLKLIHSGDCRQSNSTAALECVSSI